MSLVDMTLLLSLNYLFFVLNYVPADSGSRCRWRYAPVTIPEVGHCTRSWYVLLMAFVLQVIRCGI